MPDTNAIPVAVHGVTWTTALVGLLNLLVGGALVQWLRTRPSLKQLELNAEDKLRMDLILRVGASHRGQKGQERRPPYLRSCPCLRCVWRLQERLPVRAEEAAPGEAFSRKG